MVIQRWQSVLLLCAAVLMTFFCFVSLGQIQLPDYTCNFTSVGFKIEGIPTSGGESGYVLYTWPLLVLSILSAFIPAVSIFCYKKLRFQKSLCLIELVVLISVITVACVYGYRSFESASVSWGTMAMAPIVSFIVVMMAYQRICSDQRLLRAADRLR